MSIPKRCEVCGRFISGKDANAMYWVPWGSLRAHCYHGPCWLKVDATWREQLTKPENVHVTPRKLNEESKK